MTLFGDAFGPVQLQEQLYLSTDPLCTDSNLNAVFSVYGGFVLNGPTNCGGACPVCMFVRST